MAGILAACQSATPSPTPARTPLAGDGSGAMPQARARAAFGRVTYEEHCVACHGTEGRGDGPAGKVLRPPPGDFVDGPQLADRSPADYEDAIAGGVPGTAMLRWDHVLDDMARWDVAFYLWELATSSSEIERGRFGWEAECAACHADQRARLESFGLEGASRGELASPRVDSANRGELASPRVESASRGELISPRLDAPNRAELTRGEAVVELVAAHPERFEPLAGADLQAVAEYIWTFLYEPSWSDPAPPIGIHEPGQSGRPVATPASSPSRR